MRGVSVFDKYAQEYDHWFEENERIYQAEIKALQRFIPLTGLGIEVGVGSGRFAIPFGIKIGIDPSRSMVQLAKERSILVCQAWGEQLPFHDKQFDFALLVTVICFVDDVPVLLRETRRVLKTEGRLILGFIDRNSVLGKLYEGRKDSSKFYREAHFYSVAEVADCTREVGFGNLQFCQTIFSLPSEAPKTEQIRDGYGEGAFVVLCGEK